MVPKSLAWPPSVWSQTTICRHRSVEQIADEHGFVRWNRGLFTAIQDQVVLRRNYRKYIFKQPDAEEVCRRSGKESETVQHITAACEQLAPTEYVNRNDELAKIIDQELAEAAEFLEDKCPYYKYTPVSVLENENFKLYWNRSILMDKTITSNWPDITFINKKKEQLFDRQSCTK